MSEQKPEETKSQKLVLGGRKLTLNRLTGATKIPKIFNNTATTVSSSLVVEVKRGKAVSEGLIIKKSEDKTIDEAQLNRRFIALQKAQENNRDSSRDSRSETVSTLSRLAAINQTTENQTVRNQSIETQTDKQDNPEEQQITKQPGQVKISETGPSTGENIPNKTNDIHANNLAVLQAAGKESLLKPLSTVTSGVQANTKNKVGEEEKEVITKPKTELRKLRKSDIMYMLNEDPSEDSIKKRSLASIIRARTKEKRKYEQDSKKQEKVYREVIIPEVITVGELANKMTERTVDVIKELMKLGVIATFNQVIDADTAELIVTSFGHTAKRIQESDIENILLARDEPELMEARAPIVTVMGHVDHGKTSLLDALKATDIAAKEAGGITQHIGAYSIMLSNQKMITFIDTPGHEAFTEMRTRGAKVTDIVVLVVAADDGIKAQTVEAISHAKAAGVPIIVAINKIDKPDANVEKVKNELLAYELVPEDLGGDIMTVEVSAKKKLNLDRLEEAILLLAEMQELKANPHTKAAGVVIESKIDSNRGISATMLVQRGTLKKGDLIVAGTTYGRVKRMNNDKGKAVDKAGPSLAVEIYGLNEIPTAGDLFNVVDVEKQARDITTYRSKIKKDKRITVTRTSMEDMLLKVSGDGKTKELNLIIKADVNGSIEAITGSLDKIINDEVKLRFLHQAVGRINESDVSLAMAAGALIIGFNVRANSSAAVAAEKNKIEIRYYSVIYDLVDDVKTIISGMLSPIIREKYLGSVLIREVFNISKIGNIAGSYVTKGVIKRGGRVRLLREDIVIYEGKLKTLKRFKEEVKEVKEGYECGIAFENYNDIRVGDLVEVFEIVEEQKQL